MAPYDPPVSHYSQLDVKCYSEDEMFNFIGKGGKKFYWLTKYLDLDYLWYDKNRKVIELWGPYSSMQNFQAHQILECELNLSHEKYVKKQETQDGDDYCQVPRDCGQEERAFEEANPSGAGTLPESSSSNKRDKCVIV